MTRWLGSPCVATHGCDSYKALEWRVYEIHEPETFVGCTRGILSEATPSCVAKRKLDDGFPSITEAAVNPFKPGLVPAADLCLYRRVVSQERTFSSNRRHKREPPFFEHVTWTRTKLKFARTVPISGWHT